MNQDCDLNVSQRLRIWNKVNDQLFISSLRTEVLNTCCTSRFLRHVVTMSMFLIELDTVIPPSRLENSNRQNRDPSWGEEEFNISVHCVGYRVKTWRSTVHEIWDVTRLNLDRWNVLKTMPGMLWSLWRWWIRDRWNVIPGDFEFREKCWRCKEIESWE